MSISLRRGVAITAFAFDATPCHMFMVAFYALLAYVLLEVIGHSSNALAAFLRRKPTPEEACAQEMALQKRRRQMFWEWSLVLLILAFVVVRYWRWFNPF